MTEYSEFLGIDYPTWWFLIVGAVLSGYAILDGFDLGAGALHLFLRKERSRRIALNAVGPVWDGNEVWLVIAGGALFAGFPVYYAAILSGLYVPFMLLLAALIFRAVSIEFRSKEPMRWWRRGWDFGYWLASVSISLLIGGIMGCVLEGFAVAEGGLVSASSNRILRPFPILMGFTVLSIFSVHGALYLVMKTEHKIRAKFNRLLYPGMAFMGAMILALTIYTINHMPSLTDRLEAAPALLIIPAAGASVFVSLFYLIRKKQFGWAFAASCLQVALLFILAAVEFYPTLLPSTLDAAFDLTVYNAASSDKSLGIMLGFAAIGIPLVGLYTFIVYRAFHGKVILDETSY